jgi:hypothetical protein
MSSVKTLPPLVRQHLYHLFKFFQERERILTTLDYHEIEQGFLTALVNNHNQAMEMPSATPQNR